MVTSQPRPASASAVAAPNTPAPTTTAFNVARVMAGGEVAVAVRRERRLGRAADLGRVAAAGVEPAAGRRVGGAGHVALEHDPLAPREVGIRDRHRREQRLRVGMHRRRADVLRRPDLDHLAEVHDGDPVGDLADHREVVGDEHVGRAELVLEVLEQVDDLRLDRHVERRDGLVGDDQLRSQRERPGDADPLALAAGELVREAARVLGREADERQQLAHLRRGSRAAGRRRGSASAARCSRRSACAGSATRTDPGRSSGCRGGSAAARRATGSRCRGRRTRRSPRSGR